MLFLITRTQSLWRRNTRESGPERIAALRRVAEAAAAVASSNKYSTYLHTVSHTHDLSDPSPAAVPLTARTPTRRSHTYRRRPHHRRWRR